MRISLLLLLTMFFAHIHAEEADTISQNGISLSTFERSDYPKKGQCGCWYYYPVDKKFNGKVIALGDAGSEAIYLKIDGAKVKIGNWKAKYLSDHHAISYHDSQHRIDIVSKLITESRYSSSYTSTIKVEAGSKQVTLEAFGSCGC